MTDQCAVTLIEQTSLRARQSASSAVGNVLKLQTSSRLIVTFAHDREHD